MRVIVRRLRRLEERLCPALESWEMQRLRGRLEAARLRSESPPISSKHEAMLRGRSIPDILNSSRGRWDF
jgi:hypothetical protein